MTPSSFIAPLISFIAPYNLNICWIELMCYYWFSNIQFQLERDLPPSIKTRIKDHSMCCQRSILTQWWSHSSPCFTIYSLIWIDILLVWLLLPCQLGKIAQHPAKIITQRMVKIFSAAVGRHPYIHLYTTKLLAETKPNQIHGRLWWVYTWTMLDLDSR